MSSYRHVGTHTTILDTPYDIQRFGQLVEIPDEIAHPAIIERGAGLLPPAEFDKLGFDEDHLKRFGMEERLHLAPPEFHALRMKAFAALDAFRKSLQDKLSEKPAPKETPFLEPVKEHTNA